MPNLADVAVYFFRALDDTIRQIRRGPSRKVTVPNLIGDQGDDIHLIGLKMGIHAKVINHGPGPVVAQDPAPNTKVRRDSYVEVTVG